VLKFIQGILSVPSVLVGLIALLGLIAQKKPVEEIVKGTIKTVLGFIVLSGGAGIIVGSLSYFGNLFQHGFNVQGVVPNNEAVVSMALEDFGTYTALIMAFGMVANILIARFTPMKFIFLTGHHTLYMACLIAVTLQVGGMDGALLVALGSIILGFTMAFFPFIAQPIMREITGTDEVGFGHFGTIGYVFSGYIAKAVGKGSKSTEEITFPKRLSFLRDNSISISITMCILYLIVTLAAGQSYVERNLSGGQNFILFAILQSITFAAGVFVVLSGVRLILAEIVPAFKGFSEKIVPDAKPALDCPIVFPYAPNAVFIGFISSFMGGIAGMALCGVFNWILILPGVVPHFFCGASAGVFGNAMGGRRGAIIGAFSHGALITFLPILLLPVLGNLGFANTTFSDTDFCGVGIVLGNIVRLFR
jgi:PTS system ascorbate-specific IIC component